MLCADIAKKVTKVVTNPNWDKIELVAGGFILGTAGLKVLGGKGAKKVYTETTAAALRAKDYVMSGVTAVREGADDVLADAKILNEQRAAEDDIIIDDEPAAEAEAEPAAE